jgi:hypothetical protein
LSGLAPSGHFCFAKRALFGIACVGMIAFVYLAVWAFNGFNGLGLDLDGAIALTLGTVLAAALGVGLMSLVFYSDRSGQDDAARDAGKPSA